MAAEGPDRRSRTRQALLDAGATLLPGAVRAGLAHSLGPARVARRAGVSRQTFYRHFGADEGPPPHDEYVVALACDLLRHATAELRPYVERFERLPELESAEGADAFRRLAGEGFTSLTEPTRVLEHQLLRVLAAEEQVLDPERRGATPVTDALREYYATLREVRERTYAALFASWGRRAADPPTLEEIEVLVGALGEGLVARHIVEPEVVTGALQTNMVWTMLPVLTRPASEPAPSGPPGSGPTTVQQRAGQRRSSETRARVLRAARAEFSARGYHRTTIAAIAEAAGVSETTVYEHFGSKAGVAAAGFEPALDGLRRGITEDTEAGLGVVERIRRHLARLSDMLHRSPGVVAGILDTAAYAGGGGITRDPRDPRLVAPMSTLLAPLLAEGQRVGELHDDVAPHTAARAITSTMLLRVFGNPGEEPAETARILEAICLRGLCARP